MSATSGTSTRTANILGDYQIPPSSNKRGPSPERGCPKRGRFGDEHAPAQHRHASLTQRLTELVENPTSSVYWLDLFHGSEPKGIIVRFEPYYQAGFDTTGIVQYQLVCSFLSQLRSHFHRPSSDEVVFSVASTIGVTYAISAGEVVRTILGKLQAKTSTATSGELQTVSGGWGENKIYVEFRSTIVQAEAEVHLALITVHVGLPRQSAQSIINSPITTSLLLPLIDFSVKSLIRELEIDLQADEGFISECKRLKKVLTAPTPTGVQQTQSLADIPPKLSTMIIWRGVAVPGRGGLGPEMFSLLRGRVWKVTLQAVVFVWLQPVTDGTVPS